MADHVVTTSATTRRMSLRAVVAAALLLPTVVLSGQVEVASAATVSGPTLIADLNDAPESGSPGDFLVVGSSWWFEANDGVHGEELWTSDGTPSGTVRVTDINPSGDSQIDNLVEFNGQVYFTADDGGQYGEELWRTDGTTTELVHDVWPGGSGGLRWTQTVYEFEGHLYFEGEDGTDVADEGAEMWRTDGTTTEQFAVLVPGSRDADLDHFATVDYSAGTPTMFFRAGRSGVGNGIELWALEAGSSAPVEIDLVVGNSAPYQVTAVGDFLYMLSSGELWRIEPDTGTPGQFVGSVVGGTGANHLTAIPANNPTRLVLSSGSVANSTDKELYVVKDGTSGLELVADINPGVGSSSILYPTAIGPLVVFSATDGTNGHELYMSNGQPATTPVFIDIVTGVGGSVPSGFEGVATPDGPRIVFQADDGTGDRELWVADPVLETAVRVADLRAAASSNPRDLTAIGNQVLFQANDGIVGEELLSVDFSAGAGTPAVSLVKDINQQTEGSYPSDFAALGDIVLFNYQDATDNGLATYDPGTGVVELLELFGNDSASNLTAAGQQVFFRMSNDATGSELWVTDGTPGGAHLVEDIETGPDSSYPDEFAALGDRLLFSAEQASTGEELWISDGTELGTTLLLDANSTGSGDPREITVIGDTAFFRVEDDTNRTLWSTDGTPGGTAPVVTGPGAPDYPEELVALGDLLLFEAEGSLWSSDGAPGGTQIHDTAAGGHESDDPDGIVVEGELAFYIAGDGTGSNWLWATGAAIDSSIPLIELGAGEKDDGEIRGLGDGRVVASVNGAGGKELVVSDGTISGTTQLPEIVAGPEDGDPFLYEAVNGVLFLTASDPAGGHEVWKTDGSAVTPAGPTVTGPADSIDDQLEQVTAGTDFLVHGDRLYLPMLSPTSTDEPYYFEVTPDVPDAPTNPVAALSGKTGGSVSWDAAPDVTGAPVTGYTVTSSPDGKTCTTTGALTCVVNGLKADASYTFTVVATNRTGDSAPSTASNSVLTTSDELDAAAKFVPLPPLRLFDTRAAEAAPGPKGKLGDGDTIDVQITGAGGVPAEAVAVVMNLTVVDTDAAGFVTAFPTGTARPNASAVNITQAGQVRPNLVTVKVGVGGKVSLFSRGGSHLLGDVAGYYVDADATVQAGRFVAVTPQRLFDTRPEESSPGPKGKLGADDTIEVTATGFGDVPDSGVAAIVVNLTATQATAGGFVTAYPTGQALPKASNLNLGGVGDTAPNLAIVPVGDNGKISFYSKSGTHLLGDVTGYITDDTAASSTAGLFVPLDPTRVFDTREEETPPGPKGYVAAGATIDAGAAGAAGVPDDAAALVLNVVGINSQVGYLTAWERGPARPKASTLNFAPPSDTRANAAMLPIGVDGEISFFTLNGADILADTAGYFLG